MNNILEVPRQEKLLADIEFLKQWIVMPDDDYRNNILAVKKKMKRVLEAIR